LRRMPRDQIQPRKQMTGADFLSILTPRLCASAVKILIKPTSRRTHLAA
jgi:hypothetical protein